MVSQSQTEYGLTTSGLGTVPPTEGGCEVLSNTLGPRLLAVGWRRRPQQSTGDDIPSCWLTTTPPAVGRGR
eukprot:8809078-Pyramimonas_sp.AAC.1